MTPHDRILKAATAILVERHGGPLPMSLRGDTALGLTIEGDAVSRDDINAKLIALGLEPIA